MTGTIADLWPISWFNNPDDSMVSLRLYMALINEDDLKAFQVEHDIMEHFERLEIAFTPLYVGTLELMKIVAMPSYSKQGIRVFQTIDKHKIAEGYYIALVTPWIKDGVETPEYEADRRLNRTAALVRSVLGTNYLRECVFRGNFKGNGQFGPLHGPIFKMPMPVEKAKISRELIGLLTHLLSAVNARHDNTAVRLRLALTYLYQGTENSNFLDYWMALELACDGRATKIRETMHRAFGGCRLHEVDTKYGLKIIRQWRHDLVHNGIEVNMSAEVERMLQLLAVDLITYELGFTCQKLFFKLATLLDIDLAAIHPQARGIYDTESN